MKKHSRTMKSTLVWILVISLVLPLSFSFGSTDERLNAEPVLQSSPTSGIGGGAAAIAARGNSLPYTGYFEQGFTASAVAGRQVRVYIPEGARLREYFAVLAMPSGTDVTKFLMDSGWFDIADQNNLGLIIAMPRAGGWGTPAEEEAYMTYIVSGGHGGGARTWFSTINTYYLVGYGDGGDILQQYAAANPLFVISQAYFDSKADAAKLAEYGEYYYVQGQEATSVTLDANANATYPTSRPPHTFQKIQRKDVPVPTLFVGENIPDAVIDYWKASSEIAGIAEKGAGPLGSDLFTQSKSRAIATSMNDVVSKVAVLGEKIDYAVPSVSQEVYAFLGQYSRYDVSCPWGNALGWRLPSSEYDRVPMQTREGTTNYNREYLIYIPDKAKDKSLYPNGAPVVFVFAGMTQPNTLFFDSSQWYDVAREKGFAVVVPNAKTQSNAINTAWSQNANDIAFVEAVLADIKAKPEYNGYINFNRLYVTGQSQGGGFASYVAAVLADKVTAVGVSSALSTSSNPPAGVEPVPGFFIYGEHDTQNYTNSQTRFLAWHGLSAANSVATPSGLPLASGNDIGYIVHPNTEEYPGSRYAKWVWCDSDDVPRVMRVSCLGRSHNNIVSDAWLMWEDWFSKWDRDETGKHVYGVPEPSKVPVPVSLNGVVLANTPAGGAFPNTMIDRSRIIEQPEVMQGYFTHYFPATNAVGAKVGTTGTTPRPELAGRTYKLYISERAPLRTYLTVIAVPDGVDTSEFLYKEGWFDQAEKYGEILFVLEPRGGKWGTPSEEAPYLAACLEELIGNTGVPSGSRTANTRGVIGQENIEVYVLNANGTSTRSIVVATAHSTNYFVGYGEGAKVLESFTSNNPLRVISQAFIGGDSLDAATFSANSARIYNGVSTSTYQPGENDAAFRSTLQTIADNGGKYSTDFVTNADIPVPTLLSGDGYAGSASLNHWINVNDAVATAEAGVYRQKIDSNAWATDYANQNILHWDPMADYGVSQVRLTADTGLTAEEIRSFLAQYTRFTWQWAYSNHLNYRLDYFEAGKASRYAAAENAGTALPATAYTRVNGSSQTVSLHANESAKVGVPGIEATNGTVFSTMFAYARYSSGAGPNEAREAIIYVPDSAKAKYPDGAPMVIVYPGMTHAPITFMDASHWWGVASDEGLIVVIVGENYTSPVALNHTGNDDSSSFARSLLALIKDEVLDLGAKVDFGRVYASGHSAGNQQAVAIATTSETYFAGVSGTSFPSISNAFTTTKMMPVWVFFGHFDTSASNTLDPWVNNNSHIAWLRNAWRMNGLSVNYPATGTAYDKQVFVDSTSMYAPEGRYFTYGWDNWQGVSLVRFTRTLAREHNCYPEEFRMAWGFLSKFRVEEDETGAVTRYYSESAFSEDDVVVIFPDKLRVGIGAGAESDIAKNVEFALSVSNAKNLLTVEAEFVIDGSMLAGTGIEAEGGFTAMNDIFWQNVGGGMWKGTVTLAYKAGGDDGLTAIRPVEIAKLIFTPKAAGDTSLRITSVRATGLVGDTTSYLDLIIAKGEAVTNIDQRAFSKYDLNRDNAVDALDLGIMLLYCGFDKDSPDWGALVKVNDSRGKPVTASMCDVNGDGVIDMLDLLDLFIHYTK
ncbi:MAG: dockerin type I domain-containing protein [Clostridiales bacterium]|nr:dockerin type I domain-containing protein [Clostridiales bacterium]